MKRELINIAKSAPGTVAKTIQNVVKPFHIMNANHERRRNLNAETSFLFVKIVSSIISKGINAKKIMKGKPRAGQLKDNNTPVSTANKSNRRNE